MINWPPNLMQPDLNTAQPTLDGQDSNLDNQTVPVLLRHPGRDVIATVAFIVLTLLAFWPVGPFDNLRLPLGTINNPARNDPQQMIWFLSWLPYAVTHNLNIFYTQFIEYPQGANLADNTSVPFLGLIAWPITANVGPIAAFNFLVRLAIISSSVSMYFVSACFVRLRIVRFLAGLTYGFGPYMASQVLHLDLLFVPIPVLLVWLADEIVRRRKLPSVVTGLLIGLLLAIQMLISPDVLSGCLVVAGLFALYIALRYWSDVVAAWRYIFIVAACALIVLILIDGYPVFEMVWGSAHINGPVIPAPLLQGMRADLIGSVIPSSNQLVAPPYIVRAGNALVGSNISENGTYLGFPFVLVLLVAIKKLRRDKIVGALSVLCGLSFLLSLGNRLVIGSIVTPIPLPEAIFAHLPLLDNTIPARYDLFVAIFAVLILAVAVDRALVKVSDSVVSTNWYNYVGKLSLRHRRLDISALVCVMLFVILPGVPFPSSTVPWPVGLPKEISTLVPKGAVVLTYPFASPRVTAAMDWQAQDGFSFKLLGGYANVKVSSTEGSRWPILLNEPYVQELLSGDIQQHEYPPPSLNTSVHEYELLAFLKQYHVTAVVYWASEAFAVPAYKYLSTALGKPLYQTKTTAIWVAPNGQWPTKLSKA
ncbi:MAG: hypothetical protein HKL80_02340 [Acidimicrobiales bacterium]|nr:hypothetical protein [Acidimicrobiales bacterium]